MTKNLSIDEAALAIVEQRLRADTLAQHMVLMETQVLLIAHLHRVGAVDAQTLAEELQQTFELPELRAMVPLAHLLAKTTAARIRDAASQKDGATEPLPAK